MAFLYITSKKGKLGKSGETLVFSDLDGTQTVIFPYKTKEIFVLGKIDISSDAFYLLFKHKIEVVFLASNGKYNSRLVYETSKNVLLRQKQYQILDDKEKSLKIAKSIVQGKIKNQIAFMQRIKRKTLETNGKVEREVKNIKAILDNIEQAKTFDELRGQEGIASKIYFSVFALNITSDFAIFKTRSKNPPKSNVNAVLSFLYILLSYRVHSALESLGLDVMVGNLHSLEYGRNSLVFDLMEEFRVPVAEAVCCSLFNLGTLKKDDFRLEHYLQEQEQEQKEGEQKEVTAQETSKEDEGILLTRGGLKKAIDAFQEKIESCVLYNGQRLSFERIIVEQTKMYKRVILQEEKEYRSFCFK